MKSGTKEKEVSFFTMGTQALCWWAICCSLTTEAAVAYANDLSPSGTSNGWRLTDEKFPEGSDNPHSCPDKEGNTHYLLEC